MPRLDLDLFRAGWPVVLCPTHVSLGSGYYSLGNGRYQIINHGAGAALDGAGRTTVGATTVLWTPNVSTDNEWAIAAA